MGKYDIVLRHVVQRHASALVQGLSPGIPVESASWIETQLTAMERRMDKALEIRGVGQRRLLHLEVVVDPERDLASRIGDYASMLRIAQRSPAAGSRRDGAEAPPIKSVALILRGRARSWPRYGALRTSWPKPEPFSGHRYQIEAVYQRTVDELLARPGAFWLVFAPLAVDADAAAMRRVLEELRRRASGAEDLAELCATLLVVAELDTWGHNLREEIKVMLQQGEFEQLMEFQTYREAFQEGRRAEIEAILQRLLMRRLGRELSPDEQTALSNRAATVDSEQAVTLADLPVDALRAWLMRPDAE